MRGIKHLVKHLSINYLNWQQVINIIDYAKIISEKQSLWELKQDSEMLLTLLFKIDWNET